MGRASTIAFQQVQANFSNVDSQVYTKPLISIWEHLGTLLRTYRGMLASGNSSDIYSVMQSLDNMLGDMDAKIPEGSFDVVQKLKVHIQKALHDFDIVETRVAVCTCNDVLAAAIEQHSKAATIEYQNFIVASCSGGASRGHALIKCFERDAGRSYEDLYATSQLEQGVDVSARMDSRIDFRAVAKWNSHRNSRGQQIDTAMAKLKEAMQRAEPLPRTKIYELRRVLASWPAKAGLGVDLWVLQMLAGLPDSALRILLQIIQLVEAGHYPLQILIVFIYWFVAQA